MDESVWDYHFTPGELVFVDDSYPAKIIARKWDDYFGQWDVLVKDTKNHSYGWYSVSRIIHRKARFLRNGMYRVMVHRYHWDNIPKWEHGWSHPNEVEKVKS